MSDVCEICGDSVTSWSARYKADTIHCKKCFNTDKADAFIKNKESESIEKQGNDNFREQNDPQVSVSSNTDYATSIIVSKFVSTVGWSICIIAVIFVFGALATADKLGLISLAPGLGIFVGGLVLVVAGQSLRAIMDNTNYSKQMLEEMRKKT